MSVRLLTNESATLEIMIKKWLLAKIEKRVRMAL